MTTTKDGAHHLHEGERQVQKRRHTPTELTEAMPHYISRDMPQQHSDFYTSLSYLPLATLDDRGRPWASLLVTASQDDPSIGVSVAANNTMDVVAETNPYDPFVGALESSQKLLSEIKPLFAGVGVDFTNRRRNKIAGSIDAVSIGPAGRVALRLISDQHLGNCPKYITVRALEYQARTAERVLDSADNFMSPLPDAAKALVDRTSTTFLATKHVSDNEGDHADKNDMGLNHRGGAPGFVRIYEEIEDNAVTTCLLLPDHSGNRFYQSLGNIDTDRQVGVVFPDFSTGDVLYVTGDADNVYDDDAEELMPRVTLLTRIRLTGAVMVKGGIGLRLTSDEQYSPYNPPVRYTRRELEQMGHLTGETFGAADQVQASLASIESLSKNISTFTFKLSSPVEPPLPGGFGVFDFSSLLDAGYSHMNEAHPQMVNEDYVRTWTLSNAAEYDPVKEGFAPTDELSVTVKRKPCGLISNVLHHVATRSGGKSAPMIELDFKGTGGVFSCFDTKQGGELATIPPKMLWVAGGVGVTPFMSMWDGIQNIANAMPKRVAQLKTDIVLMFAGRGDDLNVLDHFMAPNGTFREHITMRILAYQSSTNEGSEALTGASMRVKQRRLQALDFDAVPDLADRDVFLCGPDALMALSEQALLDRGVEETRLTRESFYF